MTWQALPGNPKIGTNAAVCWRASFWWVRFAATAGATARKASMQALLRGGRVITMPDEPVSDGCYFCVPWYQGQAFG